MCNVVPGGRLGIRGEKLQPSRFWPQMRDNFLLELLTNGVGSLVCSLVS